MRIIDEPRMTMSAAASRLGVHISTLFRWAQRGVRGRKLPTVVIGGQRYVLERDLEQFLEALNAGRHFDGPDADRSQAVARQLDAMGIKRIREE